MRGGVQGKGPMAAGESNTSEFKGAKVPDNMLPSWRVDELLDIPGLADGCGPSPAPNVLSVRCTPT